MIGEHYIPLSRSVVQQLAAQALPEASQARFNYLAALIKAWFHFVQHDALEAQKQDLEALLDGSGNADAAARFAASLKTAALRANFSGISEAQLNEALAEESTFRIRLAVDFSDFEEVVFYGRGATQRRATVKRWWGLTTEDIEFTNYESVLVFIRFKRIERLPETLRGQTVLKLFANVPKADLEMLFPNSEVRMRLIDKLMIGVPAFVSGLIVLFTKLGSALLLAGGLIAFWIGLSNQPVTLDQAALVGLMTAAGALGGYLWKQFSNFKNRKIRFMKTLTERLYFQNLDNNAGVLTALSDYAEESECKETLLAYTCLLRDGPASAAALKSRVEALLQPHSVSFDIDDAVAKLTDLALASGSAERLEAVEIETAIAEVDKRWDGLFSAQN